MMMIPQVQIENLKEHIAQEGPGPSSTPPAKEPKETPQKEKGAAQGHEKRSTPTKEKAL